MTNSEAEVTITIPAKQAAAQHIEHLQAVLTTRNNQIERLTEQLAQAEQSEPNQAALASAYKRGWQSACNELMSITQRTAQQLGKLRKEAFDAYLNEQRG